MSPLRIAVVDDEPMARLRLRRLLGTHLDVEIVGEFANGRALANAPGIQAVDVILLDVSMPETNGFAALALLPEPRPAIIFVTAHSRYAVDAFDARAIDYLLKPVSGQRLAQALDRARHAVASTRSPAEAPAPAQRLSLKVGPVLRFLDLASIDFLKVRNNEVDIHSGSRTLTLKRTLQEIEQQLSPDAFTRVHRSCIVRNDAIQEIEALASGRYLLKFRAGVSIRSGRSFRQGIQDAFGMKLA